MTSTSSDHGLTIVRVLPWISIDLSDGNKSQYFWMLGQVAGTLMFYLKVLQQWRAFILLKH